MDGGLRPDIPPACPERYRAMVESCWAQRPEHRCLPIRDRSKGSDLLDIQYESAVGSTDLSCGVLLGAAPRAQVPRAEVPSNRRLGEKNRRKRKSAGADLNLHEAPASVWCRLQV